MISQKDPKSKGIEGAFMEKSEMRKLAEFIEKLSWDDLPEEVKTTVSFRVLDLIGMSMLLEKNFSQQWYVAMKPSAGSVWRWE